MAQKPKHDGAIDNAREIGLLASPTRIELVDTLSGPRYTGPMGAAALFSPIASIVNIVVRNPMGPIRIESIMCETEISPGRTVATIESVLPPDWAAAARENTRPVATAAEKSQP